MGSSTIDLFHNYFKEVSREFKRGETGELTFRSYLKELVESISPQIRLSEENKRIKGVGKPDFTCFKGSVKIGYVETKDIGIDLDDELKGEQLERYSNGAIPNIILTDYTRFILYTKKEVRFDITLLNKEDLKQGKISIKEENANKFEQMLNAFSDYELPTIKRAEELAFELSKRAKLLKIYAKVQLEEDLKKPDEDGKSSIFDFYEAFRELIKEADIEECADAYAQTLTYGLFLSKIGSGTKIDRRTAATYIPSSIKIIKKIFSNITGDELPQNLSWIVDEIIDILNATDADKILSEFVFEGGKQYKDPFIHFYEDFLREYDPAKRKQLGVYYTPEPVVSFITESINSVLKREFGKENGFADDSVNSLDFATGTGTFLANAFVISLREIRNAGLTGIENEKIKNHLLKDFYGFEILVSPYVIAHLKLTTLLKKEGYDIENDERVQIYLTNTLDPRETIENLRGFLKELTQETLIANTVKRKTQILVVMGNPPYSVSSSNKSGWITSLMKDYKEGLEERNIQPLDDDYIKFIRFAQWKIEQNNHGIVGLISNNRYLDGIIHREMRKKLTKAFDCIYILNLHGDSKRKETVKGKVDRNVFDIQQGVAIALFIKNADIRNKGIFYADLFGSRQEKFDYLYGTKLSKINWQEITPKEPYYFLTNRDVSGEAKYSRNLSLPQIFETFTSGVKTHRDAFIVSNSKNEIIERLDKLVKQELNNDLKERLNCTGKEEQKFINHLKSISNFDESVVDYDYRPFDTRKIFYDTVLITRHREAVMKNMSRANISIVTTRLLSGEKFNHVFCSEHISDICLLSTKTSESGYAFPLYVYNDINISGTQKGMSGESVKKSGKQPNFTKEFQRFIAEKYKGRSIIPEDILGYIYSVLHSSKYRARYQELLKMGFPRIPFVDDYGKFKKLSELGNDLILLHLMKNNTVKHTTKFDMPGDRKVDTIKYSDDKVYINDKQYFEGIPSEVWEFMVGGYKVLDKWLKERKNKQLSSREVEHFIKMVGVISETLNIIRKIDDLGVF